MSGQDRCPNGNPDCEFGLTHEVALTEKIMRMIAGYSQDEPYRPVPIVLARYHAERRSTLAGRSHQA
jgi:hypothetical protein